MVALSVGKEYLINQFSPRIVVGRKGVNMPYYLNVYIGRGSVLGNPYPVTSETSGSRDERRNQVCDKYTQWFEMSMNDMNSPQHREMVRLWKLLKEGKHLNLQCFCSPLRCHGDTLKAFLLKYI